ncbi:DUF2397 family protein [Kribbella pittospori]|uniref:DUF2397 family protein n=1 Tax=Kribbella pittospori TaxID=722689 RepID=UPI0013F44A71|nr:DUF2397 family protein [Kribbella pittospori]
MTRRAEQIRLAGAIERAPSDEAAGQIWETAAGALLDRHLLLVPESADDHGLCWFDAPAAGIGAS